MKVVNIKTSKVFPESARRASGVLLHVTSLPNQYGIGDLGPASYRWIDLLRAGRQHWWQVLPLGPCGEGNSPYRCYSAFAGNPLLISPDLLIKDRLLTRSEVNRELLPLGQIDYAAVSENKQRLLRTAHDRFSQTTRHPLSGDFRRFIKAESKWLDDFVLFMAIGDQNPGQSWTLWPTDLMHRKPAALSKARAGLSQQIEFHQFQQFLFFRQLSAMRKYAKEAGVSIIGDLPIFVSPESADVWTNHELFQLDRKRRPTAVAGVPPDIFSLDGQRWGNPLYNWKRMQENGFAWWRERLGAALRQADLVRIDHFRGFEAYWEIPANSPTARHGRWVKAPGIQLFESLLAGDSKLPLLAEDLGIITSEVEALRDRFNLPGMRVLQFGFSEAAGNPHTPHNFIKHCFAYTGTHDNDTTLGWFRTLPRAMQKRVECYAPNLDWNADPAGSMIRLLLASTADNVIIPAQDLLRLGSDARMNTPGASTGNWEWRLDSLDRCAEPMTELAQLAQTYERDDSKDVSNLKDSRKSKRRDDRTRG